MLRVVKSEEGEEQPIQYFVETESDFKLYGHTL